MINSKNNIKIEKNISKNIITGAYYIASKINTNKVLDVNNDTSTNNVTIWDVLGGDNQIWRVDYYPNKNAYKFINNSTGLVLAWNSSLNNNVFVYNDLEKADDQYWILEDVGDGYMIIKNYHNSNLVLDLYNSNTNNGSEIQVHYRNNTNNQKFKLIPSLYNIYRVDLYAKAGLAKNYTNWGIRLINGAYKIVSRSDLKAWTLDTKTTFKIFNSNNNVIFERTYDSGHNMRAIESDLKSISLQFNYSFQIIPNKWETVVKIAGNLESKINHDFAYGINNHVGSHTRFVLKSTGKIEAKKINPTNLSILDNRFGYETILGENLDLKFKLDNNKYKLALEQNNGNAVKNPFAIVGYSGKDGYLIGQKFYKMIGAETSIDVVNDIVNKLPHLEMGDGIQIIPGSDNMYGSPKIYIKGGIINNYNYTDYSKGYTNKENIAFKLTTEGLELDPFNM